MCKNIGFVSNLTPSVVEHMLWFFQSILEGVCDPKKGNQHDQFGRSDKQNMQNAATTKITTKMLCQCDCWEFNTPHAFSWSITSICANSKKCKSNLSCSFVKRLKEGFPDQNSMHSIDDGAQAQTTKKEMETKKQNLQQKEEKNVSIRSYQHFDPYSDQSNNPNCTVFFFLISFKVGL